MLLSPGVLCHGRLLCLSLCGGGSVPLYVSLEGSLRLSYTLGVAIPECWQPVLDYAAMTSSTHVTPRQKIDDRTVDTT